MAISGMTFAVLLLCAAVLWIIFIYNRLVRQKQMVEEAFSGVDVQLKRRADLIPKLVDCVKAYGAHEKALMESVTAMRAPSQKIESASMSERAHAEDNISAALARLIVVAENYPDLKASVNFMGLMDSLVETEDNIQMARRYYNGSVRDMNILVQSFPNSLFAGFFGFGAAEFFELSSLAERLPPEVQFAKH